MAACKYGDPLCPCQDGDMCHYGGRYPIPLRPELATALVEEIEQLRKTVDELVAQLVAVQAERDAALAKCRLIANELGPNA